MKVALDAAQRGDARDKSRGVNTWVNNVLSGGYHRYRPADTWLPAVDIYESRDDFYVVAELAGVDAEGIGISTDGCTLTITGERPGPQLPDDCTEVCVLVMEIERGSFERTVELPGQADVEGLRATFRCGVLWIRIPRRT